MRVRFTVMARSASGRLLDDRGRPLPVLGIGYVPALHMRIGVPKETAAGEHRVALVPEVVSKLRAKGLDVVVQSGAGADALIPDVAFTDAGAHISADAVDVWGCDAVVTIAPPDRQQVGALGAG